MKEINCFDIKEGYFITEFGEVYSKYCKGHISSTLTLLTPSIDKNGYKHLQLVTNSGIRKHFRINRLVAQLFLENPNNYPICLHIDNNVINNHYSNLKWGTISENTQQAVNDGLFVNVQPINVLNKITKEIKVYPSVSALCREFGLHIGNVRGIHMICQGKLKQRSKGKLFNYEVSYANYVKCNDYYVG